MRKLFSGKAWTFFCFIYGILEISMALQGKILQRKSEIWKTKKLY